MVNRLEWEGKKVPFVSYKGSLLSNANKKGSEVVMALICLSCRLHTCCNILLYSHVVEQIIITLHN